MQTNVNNTEQTEEERENIVTESDALAFLSDALEAQEADGEHQGQDIDLSGVDLSDLGITNSKMDAQDLANAGENSDDVEKLVELIEEMAKEKEPNQSNQELLEELQQLQLLHELEQAQQAQQRQQHNITPENEAALRELFSQFQALGLIPNSFGLTSEQEEILNSANEMKQYMEHNAMMQMQRAEFDDKVQAIEEYSNELERLIPGYDSRFMAQVVSQINQSNPEAGQRILNNPLELTKLWAKVGAKAQVMQEPTNVITSQTSGRNSNFSDLNNRVKNGKASPEEEGRLLMSL